jgi:hypothetical protein
MYVRGDIALVGWLLVGVFVFCVVTVVADFLELLFNLRKAHTLVGELKEITESSRSSTVACHRHDHLKRIRFNTNFPL